MQSPLALLQPKRLSLFTALGVALLFALGVARADEPNVNPNINLQYQQPNYQQWVNTFERPGREVYDKRDLIVAELRLTPGMTVADIGAGTGLFTRLLARQVGPAGKVYAVDISATFVQNILRTAKEQGLTNIKGIINDQKDTHLAASSIDLAFVCDTYHHFEYPHTTLRSIHQALRPGGQLIIIDFRKTPGTASDWINAHVRADQATVIQEIEAAGFKLSAQPNLLQSNYYLKFVKVDTSPLH